MREKIKKISPKLLAACYKRARHCILSLLFSLFRLCPIQNKKIVLMNIWGFGDNAKYIAEELARLEEDIEILYITNHPDAAGAGRRIRVLKTNSCRAVYALSTARVWVETNRKEGYVKKRKGQYYIQAWHGGVPLKKIEGDCGAYLGADYIKRARWDSSITDLYLSNSRFCTDMYRRAFWYGGRILECGMPRNDVLINSSKARIMETRRRLRMPAGRKLAVYAPTFRESGDASAYIQEIAELERRLGGEYAVLVRLHPLHAKGQEQYSYTASILNGSGCRDLYEILEAADMLITDYSNTMFEMAMAGKAVFLYAPDMEAYEKQRGLYFRKDELPFSIAATEEELWEHIKTFDRAVYLKKTEAFLKKVGLYETGDAARKTAEHILMVIKEGV